MQRLIWQNQSRPVGFIQPAFNQREINVLVSPIKFVAHYRMADVRQMNPDLMLPSRAWCDAKQREWRDRTSPAGKSSRKKRHEYVDREPWLIRPTVRQPDAFDKVFESVLSVPPVRIRPGVPKQRQFDSQDDDESITHLLAMMF